MKTILATLVFIQLLNVTCMAQSFIYHSDSPFGIKPVKKDGTRSAAKVMFYDFDLDGDLDLFMSGLDYFDAEILGWENLHYFLEMQENVGDRFNPVFAERTNAFDDFPFPIGLFFPAIGDVNGDGLADFIMNGEIDFIGNTTMLYAPNTGTKQDPVFEVTRFDSMGLDNFVTESFFDPALVDLDSDGDLDILMSGIDPAFAVEDGPDIPRFYYAKNFGTSQNPDFRGWYSDPYGLIPHPLAEVTTVGDIDNDGDMDVVGAAMGIPADSIHSIKVHLNTPTPEGKPVFNGFLESPFGLPVSQGEEQFLFPTLVDLDGDGDLDLFVFKVTADGNVLEYYENALCAGVFNDLSVTLCEGDVILVGGVPYSGAGDYTITLEGSDGCDSTIQLTIALIPSYVTFLEESICEGDVFAVGDEMFTTAGDYMVSLQAANGCDSLVVLALTINPGPITNIQATICHGDVYLFGDEELSVAGPYQLLLTTEEGCDSLINLELSVIELSNAVILNENILIADQFAMSYQWVDCGSGENIPGATNQSYEVPVTGNYAVNITDDTGCTAVSECVNVIISGTSDVTLSNAITIYPNPADDVVHVINKGQTPISSLTLTNLSGQVINAVLISESQTMDVSMLEQGIYFVILHINGREIVKKLVVV